MDVVTGVRITASDCVMIETPSPDQLYGRLPELLLRENMTVREIAAADESLEAVFGYLTQRTG